MMTISEIYRCARSLEAIENYARSDIIAKDHIFDPATLEDIIWCVEDDHFWDIVFRHQNELWGKTFGLDRFVLCDWVPRVPGLYWHKDAKTLRDLAIGSVEYKSKDYTTFTPLGKSRIVMGGVGTIKFPPDVNGYRLVCLSAGYNASSGIPALISPDVYEHHKLSACAFLELNGKWLQMDTPWAERFPSIKGIPRGYMVISKTEQILKVYKRNVPYQFHPFTVMEYSSGASRLFDFVYATADTRVRNYRTRLENFFKSYKDKKERYGRYLLAPDINDPLFDSDFVSPADLRAQAQLRVLETRVREQSFGGKVIDEIIQLLAENFDNDRLIRFSRMLEIPPNLWFTNAAPADSAIQLIDMCLNRNKVEELLDIIGKENSELVM